jgi:uncharacterized membrane protein YadS
LEDRWLSTVTAAGTSICGAISSFGKTLRSPPVNVADVERTIACSRL